MFKDKNVVLGVCGGIAAYKIASLASALAKQGANVFVIMTKNATNFITPTTFETLTSNKCIVDTFDRNFNFEVEHIALAKKADVVLIAPATANVIGKISNGIADDMLTTTILACTCPVIISPAMNTRMYNNKIVKDNIKRLEDYGYEIIKPASGYLACGDCGEGKMPEPKELLEYIEKSFYKKDLIGKLTDLSIKHTSGKFSELQNSNIILGSTVIKNNIDSSDLDKNKLMKYIENHVSKKETLVSVNLSSEKYFIELLEKIKDNEEYS